MINVHVFPIQVHCLKNVIKTFIKRELVSKDVSVICVIKVRLGIFDSHGKININCHV